jgi:hypothetical protein
MERIVIDEGRLAIPSHVRRSETSSQISDLAEYVYFRFFEYPYACDFQLYYCRFLAVLFAAVI